MSDVLDKVRKLKARRPRDGGGGRMQGIFHQWKDGDNILRLVGNFLEVKTHFIAPAPKRNERGLCRADAFKGDDKLSPVVNCTDWDVEKEEAKEVKTCPICKLNAIAHAIVKENPEDEKEKEAFKKIRGDANPRTVLKWNILDRDDPNIILVEDDEEKKVLGLKIATVGMEAWNDIEGIFEQMGFDITHSKDGIDIKVNKGNNGARVAYSAQAVIDTSKKPPTAMVTPFSDEERALKEHDLKSLCGKQPDVQKIIDALHEDLRELIEINLEDEAGQSEEKSEKKSEKKSEEKSEKKSEEKSEEKSEPEREPVSESSEKEESSSEEGAAINDAIDDDDILGGTSEKKA